MDHRIFSKFDVNPTSKVYALGWLNNVNRLTGNELKVFITCSLLCDPYDNTIDTSTIEFKKISFICEITDDYRRRIILRLIECGFIKRVERGLLMINPNIVFCTNEKNRKSAIATFDKL